MIRGEEEDRAELEIRKYVKKEGYQDDRMRWVKYQNKVGNV